MKKSADSKFHSTDIENFKAWLTGVVIVDGWGSFEANDEQIHVAIMHDGSGYNPGAAIAADDGFRHVDEAIQAADEVLEAHEMEHSKDYFMELQDERFAEWKKEHAQDLVTGKVTEEELRDQAYQEAAEWFRGSWDGKAWTLPAKEVAEAIRADRFANKYITIHDPEPEEIEEEARLHKSNHLKKAIKLLS